MGGPGSGGALKGDKHPYWKGDDAPPNTKRMRAQRRYKLGPCERCRKPGTDRHHKDANTGNNEPSNIMILCRRCHMTVDGRLPAFVVAGEPARRRNAQPKPCIHCGRPWKYLRKGRFPACNNYFRKYGSERPLHLGTTARGSRNGHAVLTEADIPIIRSMLAAGQSQREVARQVKVSASAIQRIADGKAWKHVP